MGKKNILLWGAFFKSTRFWEKEVLLIYQKIEFDSFNDNLLELMSANKDTYNFGQEEEKDNIEV